MDGTLIGLQELMPGQGEMEKWGELASRLNRLVGRKWRATYVLECARGSKPVTPTMRRAADQLGAILDQADKAPILAAAVPVQVFSSPDNQLAGAYIQGRARRCPECGALFVPSVSWRQWCPMCRPARTLKPL